MDKILLSVTENCIFPKIRLKILGELPKFEMILTFNVMKIYYYSKSELSEGLKCKKYFMMNKCKALADYTSHDIRFNKMSLIKKLILH